MQLPIEITYRGVEKSNEIDDFVRDKASRLDKFCDHITRCNVIIEQPNHAQHSGNPFHVRIDLTVPPGHELVVHEKPVKHEMHEPLTKVVNEAFKAMERQLKDLVDRQHLRVKNHSGASAPVIAAHLDESSAANA